jgi:hypothetical protein
MATKKISVHDNASIEMDLLPAAKRKQLYKTLRELQSVPEEQWEEHGALRVKPDEPLYALRLPDNLWALFAAREAGEMVIRSLLPQTLLDQIREAQESRATKR